MVGAPTHVAPQLPTQERAMYCEPMLQPTQVLQTDHVVHAYAASVQTNAILGCCRFVGVINHTEGAGLSASG